MKYVMAQNRAVDINGYYPNPGLMEKHFPMDSTINRGFLTFEHTDGLNYVNTEFGRVYDISKIFKSQILINFK
jgi:hypothetical protein